MDGTPQYTQHSVAWPDPRVWPLHEDRALDTVSVSFAADGGGTYGEFKIALYGFRQPLRVSHAARFLVFCDGLDAFLDPRVQAAVAEIRAADDQTAEVVVAALERAGVVPSEYHRVGLKAREMFPAAEVITVDLLDRAWMELREVPT